jgi:RND superfamily putative drug exporter
MGAGSDYCIFVLSRYREERRRGRVKDDSVRQAITWAGRASLPRGRRSSSVSGAVGGAVRHATVHGIALALGIAIALLVALTLLPSILVLLGDKLFWPDDM